MTPANNDFVKLCRELQTQIASLHKKIDARNLALRKLIAQARADHELARRVARVMLSLAHSSENRNNVTPSETQVAVLKKFAEMANRPLFPPLELVPRLSDPDRAATG
jgi:hypothetical protein